MLADFVLTYMEVVHVNHPFVMRGESLSAADNLAFLVFQKDFRRWRRIRQAN